MIDLSYWFVFPVGMTIATIAMLSGIEGAAMFSPFFIVALKLEPLVAISTSLFIEVFGFGSGLFGYLRQRSIRFDLAKQLMKYTVPATIGGVVLSFVLPDVLLKLFLCALLLFLATIFLWPHRHTVTNRARKSLTAVSKRLSLWGAAVMGMTSTGLGEANQYIFLKKMNLPVPQASGTSVFLVALSAAVASLAHVCRVVHEGDVETMRQVFSLVVFAVPGVVIGSQLGVYFSKRVSREHMKTFMGALFFVLSCLVVLTLL